MTVADFCERLVDLDEGIQEWRYRHVKMVERTIGGKRLRMVRGDITEVEVDAFVFDITEDAKLGSGFGGAIQQRGGIVIQKELDELGSVPKGEAVVTQAGILNAEYIIHVNGPKFREEDEKGKLEIHLRYRFENIVGSQFDDLIEIGVDIVNPVQTVGQQVEFVQSNHCRRRIFLFQNLA